GGRRADRETAPPARCRRQSRKWQQPLRSLRSPCCHSQCQTPFAGALGDGGDTTRVAVAATVEHCLGNAGGLRALGDELADLASLGGLVALERAQVGLERRSRRDG